MRVGSARVAALVLAAMVSVSCGGDTDRQPHSPATTSQAGVAHSGQTSDGDEVLTIDHAVASTSTSTTTTPPASDLPTVTIFISESIGVSE